MPAPRPVVLCILDGWGKRAEREANAPALAAVPTINRLMAECPNAELVTYGRDVGLPAGQMGNSEVGHMNIGAGRIVSMDLGQIELAIEDGSFLRNTAFVNFIARIKAAGGRAHLMGLVSDGGVHGHIDHLRTAIAAIAAQGVEVVVHAVTDGRDVAPISGAGFIAALKESLPDNARIGTVTGRYYAMDRDHRWERIRMAYDAIALGQGTAAPTAEIAVAGAYDSGVTDEFIPATVIGDYTGLQPGDGFFCLNFRADRAREILAALGEPDFSGWERGPAPALSARLGMVDYSAELNAFWPAMYPKEKIVNTLGAWVSSHGLRQFRVAETEKYPHVTFFLNGGEEVPFPGEDRHLAPSPKVATYDLQPEMSAREVTDAFVSAIESGYDLIICNYANPDMVGHTGKLPAAIAACEAVDQGLARVVAALGAAGGAMVVTADHGNCEVMVDPVTGGPHTSHTTSPVPVILVGGPKGARLRDGRLADLAPTLLDLLGIAPPPEMTGQSLIVT